MGTFTSRLFGRLMPRRCSLLYAFAVFGTLLVPGQNIGSLKRISVPTPPGLDRYVRDQNALIALGKAFFWDMQTGSDGRMACATCHFHAGADHRSQNQLSNMLAAFPVNHTFTL